MTLPLESYLWFKTLHIVGVVVWFAGLFYLVRLFIYHVEAEELNEDVKTAFKDQYVLIENLNALHSGVKSSQGSFSLPFDGWLMKNGEAVSIEAATVAGDITNLLNTIVEIEDESLVTHSGISPHDWVDGLSITGEA